MKQNELLKKWLENQLNITTAEKISLEFNFKSKSKLNEEQRIERISFLETLSSLLQTQLDNLK